MKKYRLMIVLAGLIATLFAFGCQKKQASIPRKPWAKIISQVEVTLSMNLADSLKYGRINKIFEENGITSEQYRDYVASLSTKSAAENLDLLREVEKRIAFEMQEANAAQKKPSPKTDSTITE